MTLGYTNTTTCNIQTRRGVLSHTLKEQIIAILVAIGLAWLTEYLDK